MNAKPLRTWLPIIHPRLGLWAAQLGMFDALYFNSPVFKTVRDLKAHLLITYSPHEQGGDTKLFHDVLEDAKGLFVMRNAAIDPV